ncbi:MAG: acyltransferase [Aquidulcibacter sp.]|uniref:acyltransferase family protein n=1 Tax=Aquidulcibacter sp. TaxID=2052990 RepID=UPI0022C8AF69|nr:acyltransferase [Aquidulcibacter sp.]MCE2892193.1 acyltransferase [Hyphomonadaceae bacterium]MCZ8210262.1 acyltransferase [Aquidulcibacter sp.]
MIAPTRQHIFPQTIEPLTGVRFFLAVGVVFFHYQLFWVLPVEAAPLLNRARLGVDIFFILSGFILTHVYLTGDRPPSYWRFISARFARVYPAHFIILMGVLALILGANLVGVQIDHANFSTFDFVTSLFLVHAWFPTQHMANWNGPSWSLSAEWFVYLYFPVFAWIGLRWRERPLWLIGLAFGLFAGFDVAYQALFGSILTEAQENLGILLVVPEFIYGIGLYFLGQKINLNRLQASIFALGMTLLLLTAMHFHTDDRLVVAIAGPFMLSLGLLAKSGQRSFLSHKWMQFGGEASFALYLVHMPILMVWRNVIQKWFELEKTYRMGLPEVAILLTLTLIAAGLIHIWLEQPSRLWLRGLFRQKPAPMKLPDTAPLGDSKG